jgi:hypothetical protein
VRRRGEVGKTVPEVTLGKTVPEVTLCLSGGRVSPEWVDDPGQENTTTRGPDYGIEAGTRPLKL